MPKRLCKPIVAITDGMTAARFVELVARTLRQSGKEDQVDLFIRQVRHVNYDPERVRIIAARFVDIT